MPRGPLMRVLPTATNYGLVGPEAVGREHDRGQRPQLPEREKHAPRGHGSHSASQEEEEGSQGPADELHFMDILDDADGELSLGTYDRSIARSHGSNGTSD